MKRINTKGFRIKSPLGSSTTIKWIATRPWSHQFTPCYCTACNKSFEATDSVFKALSTIPIVTCRVLRHGRCHVRPWLGELSRVVLSCVTLSHSAQPKRKTGSTHCSRQFFVHCHGSGNLWMHVFCSIHSRHFFFLLCCCCCCCWGWRGWGGGFWVCG